MSFCFVIGVAGSMDSQKSALADALCEAYSHRTVIHLKMEDYQKPTTLRLLSEDRNDRHDDFSVQYDLTRLQEDIKDILWNVRCRILVVEGSLILWHKGIEELFDMRVYVEDLPDGVLNSDKSDSMRDCIVASSENADIRILYNDTVENGVQKIKKTLWGLWL